MDYQIAGGKQGVADVGNDHDRLVQRLVQPRDQAPDRQRPLGPKLENLVVRARPAGQGPGRRLQPGGNQSVQEVCQQHSVILMVADPQPLAGGINTSGRIELGRIDAEVDVGHKGPQQDDAIARLDELRNLLAAHRPLV